jgi:type IV pilus assembly protein PilB
VSDPSGAFRAPSGPPQILGALLVDSGALDEEGLAIALAAQRESGERLGTAAIRIGLLAEETVAAALSQQLSLPVEVGPLEPDPAAVRLVRGTFARQRKVVPLQLDGRTLRVAMEDPLDLTTIDELQFQCGRRIQPVVATPSAIREGLRAGYEGEVSALARQLPKALASGGAQRAVVYETDGGEKTPLVRIVDLLLRRTVEGGGSDLHVEQGADGVVVRERVDGILRSVTELPAAARAALLSRIKVLAGMDISVKRRPQDGGFPLSVGDRTLSVRVSTLPVEGGEKAVLRILDPLAVPSHLGDLGFSPEDLGRTRGLLGGGQGVILTAGPTGSGKSSTLFGALGELDRRALNVVTLEDPVEYRVQGASQVQVNPRSGLTFPSALRSVLRQDPDVIMVGEIRDRETAEIAMSAAITGHTVLSTLHTIDAPSGITRLLQMGVPPHLLAGGLAGIIAQRLVRRICARCRGDPRGCPSCRGGYRGRTGIFQVLAMSDALRQAIGHGMGESVVRRHAEEAGMRTLRDDARRKVEEGITCETEVSRVLGGSSGSALVCERCGEGLPSDAAGCPQCGWPRLRRCTCGRSLSGQWRFCPDCLRRAPPIA